MAKVAKRRKIETQFCSSDFANSKEFQPEISLSIFIVPARFTKARLKLLKDLCISKGFPVVEKFSELVTHIVTKFETRQKVYQFLKRSSVEKAEIVSDLWLTACLAECKCIEVSNEHRIEPHLIAGKELDLKREHSDATRQLSSKNDDDSYQDTKYECQRCTPLNHCNSRFTKALEVLEKNARYTDCEHGESRALAFRRASCALKSYPREVKDLNEVSKLNNIGEHSKRVIAEIIKKGFSEEVEKVTSDVLFQVIELFVGIYGCGPATAKKWYGIGYRTIQDIKDNSESLKLNVKQKYGLEYYDDLSTSVTLTEAKKIKHLVVEQLHLVQSGCSAEIVGGFSRGKPSGHDVDILISHPEERKVEGLLIKLVDRLNNLGYMIHTGISVGKNVSHQEVGPNSKVVREKIQKKAKTMDNLDRCFAIMKVDISNDDDTKSQLTSKECDRSWIARRVDLIITPASQYAFSLLGWIGSKQFNRSLRLYAWKELKITVNNHGMWDYKQTPPKAIEAKCEKDIFEVMKLAYVEREERNC